MAYDSMWQDLSDARSYIMASTGCSQEEAETDICRAIADGAIDFQGELEQHTTRRFRARGTVLDRTAFQLPTEIGRRDLDWEKSTPRRPWIVKRDHYRLPGHWALERIRLLKADLRSALCAAGEGDTGTRRDSSELDTGDNIRPAPESADAHIGPDQGSTDGSQGPTISAKRRGRRPTKLTATKEAMRQEILAERITLMALTSMIEKNLAGKYDVSRDTARKARNAVLLEFHELNSRQKATNDK